MRNSLFLKIHAKGKNRLLRSLLAIMVLGISSFTGAFAQCGVQVAPYLEDFETGSGTTPPNCWVNEAEGGGDWEFDDETSRQPEASDGDHTLGPGNGGIMAWIDDSDDEDSTNLVSPQIDVSGLTNPQLAFHMWSETEGAPGNPVQQFPLHIDVHDGTNWNYDVAIFDIENSSWELKTVDLSSFSGVIQIRFSGEDLDGSFYKDIAIDDVEVRETPSCQIPTNLLANASTPTSSDLIWNQSPSSPGIGYDVLVVANGAGISGSPVYSNITTAGDTSETATGLSPATTYDAYVRGVCAVGDSSAWIGPLSFTTPCVAFTAPYSENFDAVPTADPFSLTCWNIAGNEASEIELEDFSANSGSNKVEFGDVDMAAGDTAILVSPEFSDLTAYDKRVRFMAAFEDGDQNSNVLYVGVMSNPNNSSSFVALDTVTTNLDDVYTEYIVNLDNAALIGSSNYIAIAAGAGSSFDEIDLDDFNYEAIPTCPAPDNINITNVTSSSADFSWTGGANNYEVVAVPTGNPVPGSGNPVTGTTTTISPLNATTGYDFYVREICGPNDTSIWDGPHFFQTAIQFPQGTNCTVGYDSLLFEDEFNSLANWTNTPAEWSTNSGSTSSSNTGPSGAQSGFSYAYVETSGFTNSTTDLTSPLIELSNFGGDAELTFWMHAYGATIGTLDVDIATSQSGPYTTEFTWSGQYQTSENDPWQHIGVDLSSYVGQDIYVRFSYTAGSSYTSDIAIDQVRVNACFDCSYLAGFSIGNDTTYCANQGISLPLDAGAADSYSWSTSETTQTITVDTAGQYSVTKDVAGCQFSDTIELFSTPFINLDLGPDTNYCADEGINHTLNAQNPTASYMWTDSSTSQFLTVDTAGIYTVTVTDTNGCSTTDGVYVVEHQIPNVVLPADSDYCADQTIAYTLNAGNPLATGYLWQDNSTNQTFTATTAGTYWVEVTDINGCTNADTMDIIEDPLPVVNLGNDTSYCDSEDFNITLDADNPTADFWWNDGSDDQTLLVDSDGTYWVEVTSTQNCVNSDTITVVENTSPEVDLGNDTMLAPGHTMTLHAGNAGTYLWNDGSTDTTKTITWNDVPGEFSVQVESADGCVNGDFIFIDANTGIEDVVEGDIKVYPNPTNDNANIDMNLKEGGEMMIEVYSLSGQLLQQQQYGASVGHQVVPVNLNKVESGMYIINVKLDGERIANFNITKM